MLTIHMVDNLSIKLSGNYQYKVEEGNLYIDDEQGELVLVVGAGRWENVTDVLEDPKFLPFQPKTP